MKNKLILYTLAVIALFTSCAKDGATGPAGPAGATGTSYTPHSIGERFGGGTVFYVYDGGMHGLIADTVDQSSGITWYNGIYKVTGTTGDGLDAGELNTAIIVAAQMPDNPSGNFAAKVCADYSVTVGSITYGDWYLPSKYELNLLYQKKAVVGGFADAYYWSSNESSSGSACAQFFGDGGQVIGSKGITSSVRAVRNF